MLEFWTNPMSRGQIAHWMMEELGQPYTTHWLDWGPAGNKGADFLAVNPMGKVPTIRHDGKVVTEAAAICLYLAEAFPQANLKPKGAALADYYRWTFFCSGPIEQAVTAKALGWAVPEGRDSMAGFGSFDAAVNALDQFLGGTKFVCGDMFTAADVYVGSTVDWGLMFKSMPSRPSFEAYAARLRERKAYQSAKAINAARMGAAQG
ncbi:MAG: glutathione S-transferase [Alphaproteobacteria bacterium 32-64-14]|nr:MAG: glutathione S-transferase [Alphaproteobacteria bacterium 32-64-14]